MKLDSECTETENTEANTNTTFFFFLPKLIYLALCFANLLKKWKSQVEQHDGIH